MAGWRAVIGYGVLADWVSWRLAVELAPSDAHTFDSRQQGMFLA